MKENFIKDYLAFFKKTAELPPKGSCSGELKITKMFLYCSVKEPVDFVNNLVDLGVGCDCRFLQSLDSLLTLKSPYAIDNIERDEENDLYIVKWDLSGFNTAIEALHTRESVGLKVKDAGYFPPIGMREIVINMIDAHKTVIVLDKNAFSRTTKSGDYEY